MNMSVPPLPQVGERELEGEAARIWLECSECRDILQMNASDRVRKQHGRVSVRLSFEQGQTVLLVESEYGGWVRRLIAGSPRR